MKLARQEFWKLSNSLGGATEKGGLTVKKGFAVFRFMPLLVITFIASTDAGQGHKKGPKRPKSQKKPTPVIVISQTRVSLGQAIMFDASQSRPSQPKNKKSQIISASWNFGDGTTGTGLHISHEYQAEGTYTVSLTVVDKTGKSASTTQPSAVTVTNNPPTVSIVAPSVVVSGTEIKFRAIVTDDSPSDKMTYQWQFGDGGISTEQSPTHTYTRPNRYPIILTVTDAYRKSGQAQATVEVTNRAPQAVFQIQFDETDPNALLTLKETCLDGFGSQDPDGEIRRLDWLILHLETQALKTINAGPAKLCHQFPRPGRYEITLMVTDDFEASTSSSKLIDIANRPPITQFVVDSNDQLTLTKLHFDGTSSYDLDGQILEGQWNFGDGSSLVKGLSATHQYLRPGRYDVTLTTFDDRGDSTSTTQTVVIGNRSPVAKITANPVSVEVGQPVALNAAGSYDHDGEIVETIIEPGDGTKYTATSATHTYQTAGAKTAQVTVKDNLDATGLATVVITVVTPPPPPEWPPDFLPGWTDFKLTGNSVAVKEFVSKFELRYNVKSIRLDKNNHIWTMTPLSKTDLAGNLLGQWLMVSGRFNFALDEASQSVWISHYTGSDGLAKIAHYTMGGLLVNTYVVGVTGVNILDLDGLGYLYLVTVDPQTHKTVFRVFNTIKKSLVKNTQGQILSWEAPYDGAPTMALIPDGLNLWVLYAGVGKLIHFNRYTFTIVHQIDLKPQTYDNLAIGPVNQLILTAYKRMVTLDPERMNDANPLLVESFSSKWPRWLATRSGFRVTYFYYPDTLSEELVVEKF